YSLLGQCLRLSDRIRLPHQLFVERLMADKWRLVSLRRPTLHSLPPQACHIKKERRLLTQGFDCEDSSTESSLVVLKLIWTVAGAANVVFIISFACGPVRLPHLFEPLPHH